MPETTEPAFKVDQERELYLITEEGGYSCLGFQVCIDRIKRLGEELKAAFGTNYSVHEPGSQANYFVLKRLQLEARSRYRTQRWQAKCELSPQLIGLEGKLVEAVSELGETRLFIVGKSTGWVPIHLEITKPSGGYGVAADRTYKSVKIIRK